MNCVVEIFLDITKIKLFLYKLYCYSMKRNIAVIVGGFSLEAVISIKSGEQIAAELDKERYRVYVVSITSESWEVKTSDGKNIPIDKADFSFIDENRKVFFDFVLNIIHGNPGENGVLQGYFDLIHIPYSTAGVRTSTLTFDKYLSKLFLQNKGIPMAKSLFLTKKHMYNEKTIIKELELPCFVKPNASGSSFGITKVKQASELDKAIADAFTEDPHGVIIEEFIEGTEVSCGVFKTRKKDFIFNPTEIVTRNDFFDFEAKYTDGVSDEITPARIPQSEIKEVQEKSSEIYDLFQCKGIVRVDFIIKNGVPYFLEINTIPGMSKESIFPKQAKDYGISMKEILTLLIEDRMQ